MNINIPIISTASLFLLLLTPGCTPSVRYTRDSPPSVSGRTGDQSSEQYIEYADGGDTLQSGWEASDGGDAERHKAGWLAATLSEADQGQSFRQNKQNKQNRQEKQGKQESQDKQNKQDKGRGEVQRRLERSVSSYIGVPYKYGGTTRRGFDCSGFVSAVYREVYGIPLKRTSGAMWKDGVPVSLAAARPGDLVFFKGGAFGGIDHVGIYMGKTRFVHASTKSGVVYADLKDAYYSRRFAGFRRMD